MYFTKTSSNGSKFKVMCKYCEEKCEYGGFVHHKFNLIKKLVQKLRFCLVVFVNHCTIKLSSVNKDFAKKEINFCSKELEVFSAGLVLVPIDSTGP